MPLGWQVLELAQPDYSTTKGSRYMHEALSIVKYLSLKPDHLLQDTIRHCNNIPSHYFNQTNENILNDYHDYIYNALKNNEFKFPIKITIYTENLLYDPFNSNMLNEVNVEHIENYEKYFKKQLINTNDVYNTIVKFSDCYINKKVDMINIHYNRNNYNKDNINDLNVLDYNKKQKLNEKIKFDNKYRRKIY